MVDSRRERRRVRYSGRVQGVGFRYTAVRLARSFAVVGYVVNLADGRVELVADGYPAIVERFLAAVSQRLAENIERVEVALVPREEPFRTFSIHY